MSTEGHSDTVLCVFGLYNTSQVQIPGLGSNYLTRNQFSITSGQGWLGPMLCTVKWVTKESPAVQSPTWPLNSQNCSENYPKTKQNDINIHKF